MIPKYNNNGNGFPWKVYNHEFDIPLKFFVKAFCYDKNIKFDCFQGKSLFAA